jgi:hypothetical protein
VTRIALLGLLLAGCASAPLAPKSDGKNGYSYAGLEGPFGAPGVRATIRAITRPHVPELGSHVAAWVGVDARVDGKVAWVQVGLYCDPASLTTASVLYLEHRSPKGYKLEVVRRNVPLGARFRVAVHEVKPGLWRASVDGNAVGEVELSLPVGRWNTTASAESYRVGSEANRYRYGFENVEILQEGSWVAMPVTKVLEDARDKVIDRRGDHFVATSAATRGLAGVIEDSAQESTPAKTEAATTDPASAAGPTAPAPAPRVCPMGALGE